MCNLTNSADRLEAKKEHDDMVKFEAIVDDLKFIHHQNCSAESLEVRHSIDGDVIADIYANNHAHDDTLGSEIKAYFRKLIGAEV